MPGDARLACRRRAAEGAMPLPEVAAGLVTGRLLEAGGWPLRLAAWLCDLRTRFLIKDGPAGTHRAVARNGRVLLASDRPLDELAGRPALVRLQTWHRAILPGEPPEPFGILLCVRSGPAAGSLLVARLVHEPSTGATVAMDVGGRLWLAFVAPSEAPGPGELPQP